MKQTFDSIRRDIFIMLQHVKADIDYGTSGSYGDGETIDHKSIKQTLRAVKFIENMYKLKIKDGK